MKELDVMHEKFIYECACISIYFYKWNSTIYGLLFNFLLILFDCF